MAASLLRRHPLPGCVQDTQDPHLITGPIVDQDIVLMRDQLARAGDTAKPAEVGMIDQAGRLG